MAEQQQNRFSTNSFKSQQSIEVNNELFSAPIQNAMPPASEEEEAKESDDIVREEDLQSEVDCSGGESQLKRNSMGSGSITRVTLNLSRQSSEQQQHEPIVVEETQEENVEEIGQNEPQQEVEPTIQGKAEEQEIHQAMQNSEPQKTRRPISNDSDNESVGSRPPTPYPDPDPISNDSMENEDNKIVRQPQASSRPASLLSTNGQQYRHPQSMEQQQQQKAVATESPNVEEKVLAQIRAKNNVKNLIAKFNTATVGDETKENGSNIGGDKQKSAAENGGGAVNIKAMRQKFGQQ